MHIKIKNYSKNNAKIPLIILIMLFLMKSFYYYKLNAQPIMYKEYKISLTHYRATELK